jgi:transcriptional regulator with XRE-family HTH domain
MFNYAPVAKGFTEAREKLGWSHYRLAKESGLSFATIVRLEQEDGNPALSTITQAAKALGFSVRITATKLGGDPNVRYTSV